MSNGITENIKRVQERIAEACAQTGRSEKSVELVAVSKTKSISLIREAFTAGQRTFGENYVQEAVDKAESLPEAKWHFIGSLQTNKVKQVVGKFALIESVDRFKLAAEISKVAARSGVTQDILLQIHLGDEATKHGAGLLEAPKLIEEISVLPNLKLCGLMSMPPLTSDEKTARTYFASLREAAEKWRSIAPTLTQLSMGTSADFHWAILEGATLVRVGTAIFGARK